MAILQKLLYLTYIEDEKKEKGGEKPLYQTLLAHFSRATSLLLIVKEPNIIHISLTRCILQPPLYRLSQFSSVAQLCPTLWSHGLLQSGFPVHHQCLELAQTHFHWVGDAIQPSRPRSPPFPLAFNLSQHQGLFQWVGSSNHVAKVLELQLQHQSFQWVVHQPGIKLTSPALEGSFLTLDHQGSPSNNLFFFRFYWNIIVL